MASTAADVLVITPFRWIEGRTAGPKKALEKAITEGLGKAPGIRPADVFINLVDVRREHGSVGKGGTQCASSKRGERYEDRGVVNR